MPPTKQSRACSGKETEEMSKSTKGRDGKTVPRAKSPRACLKDARGDFKHESVAASRRENTSRASKTEVNKGNKSTGRDKREVTDSSRSVNDQNQRTTSRSNDSNTPNRRDESKTASDFKSDQDKIETVTHQRVYKDNPLNRRLDRVGKPIGTVVYSKKSKTVSVKTYKDNAVNRRLKRVNQPLGSMPVTKKTSLTQKIPEILEQLYEDTLDFTIDYQCTTSKGGDNECGASIQNSTTTEAFQQAVCQYNRREMELSWRRMSEIASSRPKTLQTILDDYEGKIIAYSDLKLHKRIGQGGFGEVFFAKWRESVVAVKKLKEAKLYDKGLREFAKEIMNFCTLDHPNIVKFIGACTEMPNICIVMEYMQMSLHEAIHIRNDVDLSETERTDVVKQICEGVKYLHACRIAHCDLKTLNILLDYVEGQICEVKITDFGLSMIKATSSKPGSSVEAVRYAGTPRYSAPEVLRGVKLSPKDMMKADVYSLSLITLEVLFEQEPFHTYDRQKLRERVGKNGERPETPQDAPTINQKAMRIIQQAWDFKPENRPDIAEICTVYRPMQNFYAEELPPNMLESMSTLKIR